MDASTAPSRDMSKLNESISAVFARERDRLRGFIRRRVPAPADAEDILQDVFYELVEADLMVQPIEQVGAWLFRVARNRITDLFRRRKHEQAVEDAGELDDAAADEPWLDSFLPSEDEGPEARYARRILINELELALDELPEEQRDVFIAHELGGQSFKEIAEATGVGVNTLLSRKRYAVLFLRRRLQAIYEEYIRA